MAPPLINPSGGNVKEIACFTVLCQMRDTTKFNFQFEITLTA